jgi:hypothetical protein
MNRIKKLDNFFIGLGIGILFPGLMYFFYWLLFHHQISFPTRFTTYLMKGYLLSNVIKICGLGNLLLFYFALTYKIDKFSKGVIVSVFFFLLLIAYVSYYLEPELI